MDGWMDGWMECSKDGWMYLFNIKCKIIVQIYIRYKYKVH